MTEVQRAPMDQNSYPQTIPVRTASPQIPQPSSISMPTSSTATKTRSGHLNLDTFSPVNQNGSFEFDRVLKSGYVHKRTRKTKVTLCLRQILEGRSDNKADRLGNPFISYYDQTFSPFTKIRTKSSFATKSYSPT